ncbi:DUF2294 domain-containing protein [Bacillus sp. SJS]|uniref:DUF2294 domain-containing protein n=1 Tax=Bacillus sp. SJS TaxID=1423321 RepID=UPI0004DCCD52|nr:DUF2294 domain-containing protein [Bacillus sp. SJS]
MSKGEMEDIISRLITKWEKEYLGRGPLQVKTSILDHAVLVVLKGVLTPAEQKISETESGLLSVKKIRAELVESGADELKQIVSSATGMEIMSFHTDISTRTGERVMVFLMG